jgi:N-acetyl-gamma-glutamyl-phosphate reductase
MRTIGIVGARGHTGAELIRLVEAHPGFALAFVSSRELVGQAVAAHVDGYGGDLRYESLDPDSAAARAVDAVVLALPNDKSAPFVAAIDAAADDRVVLDLSADHRFDGDWYYGLPELTRADYAGQRRIANPGCYATAMQLALAPLRGSLQGPAQCFGVSGYSGAGTTPSERNDPERLRDNLMPYGLVGHVHEREASTQLGVSVEFMPHVAPYFRGLTVTVNAHLVEPTSTDAARALYRSHYAGEPLVDVSDAAPWVSHIAGRHGAQVGGFAVSADGRRLVVVATLDNLLKGAATQAMQNLNRAFGFSECDGIPLDASS